MCLVSLTHIPSIAQEDIYCYKRLQRLQSTILVTPFVGLPIFDIPCVLEGLGARVIKPFWGAYEIGSGFIHAYTKKYIRDNTSFIKSPKSRLSLPLSLCKVPKGAKYYISTDHYEICATKMEIIKVL